MIKHQHISRETAKSHIKRLRLNDTPRHHEREHFVVTCKACRRNISRVLLEDAQKDIYAHPNNISFLMNTAIDTELYETTKAMGLEDNNIPTDRKKAEKMLKDAIKIADRLWTMHNEKTTKRLNNPQEANEKEDHLIRTCDIWYTRATRAIIFLKALLGEATVIGDEKFLEKHQL